MQDHLSDMLAMLSLMHTGFLLPFWPRGLINSTIPLTIPFTAGATPHPCPASRHKVLFFLWGWSTNLVRKGEGAEGAQVGGFHKKHGYTLEQVTQRQWSHHPWRNVQQRLDMALSARVLLTWCCLLTGWTG